MRRLYIWLLLALGAVLFGVLAKAINWTDASLILTHANLEYLLIYIVLSIIIRILLSLRWQVILRGKEISVPFYRNLAYRTTGFAISFITPGPRVGGDAMTAALLCRNKSNGKKIKFSKAISTLVIDRAVELQTFAALFFIGVFLLSLHGDIPLAIRTFMILISGGLLVLFLYFAYSTRKGTIFLTRFLTLFSKKPGFKREIKHFEDTIISFYKDGKKDFLLSHAVSSIAWLLSIGEYKALLLMLGFNVPLYGVFIVYSFVGLAYTIPIPLALGSLEGLQAAAFSLIGLSPAGGVVLALVTRLRDIFFTIIGFMILMYYGIAPRPVSQTIR